MTKIYFFVRQDTNFGEEKNEKMLHGANPSKNSISEVALMARKNLKEMYVGKKLPFFDLAVFKLPTSTCDFVYNNVYNLHEESNF